MSRRGGMRGVHTDNNVAEAATRERRAAISEETALGRAYRKDPRLCLHVPYAKFCSIVRGLTRKKNASIGAAALAWVERWSLQADRGLATKDARKPVKTVRILPDGRKVFYG